MAFKLLKADLAERDRLIKLVDTTRDAANVAVREFNDFMISARGEVNKANNVVADYHKALVALSAWLSDIAVDRREDLDEKTDAFHDSDRGAAVTEWVDGLEEIDLDPSEVTPLALPDPAEEFDRLPAVTEIEEYAEEADNGD